MRPTARKSAATKELLRQVAAKATGKMTQRTAVGKLEAYLMNGDIIGVVSPHDDQHLIRRVRLAKALPAQRLNELEKVSAGGQSIFGQLLDEVDSATIERFLNERFRDNFVAFVASTATPVFKAMPGVFIDNMQMGQNTARVIDASCKDADLAAKVSRDTPIVLGTGVVQSEDDAPLVSGASDTATPLGILLEAAPVEPWLGRARVAALISQGVLAEEGAELAEVGTDEFELIHEALIDEGPSDDLTEADLESETDEDELAELRATTPTEEDDDEEDDDPPTAQAHNLLAGADTSYDEEDDDDDPTVAVNTPVPPPAEEVSPEDLSNWLDNGSGLSEEDLAFFEDHEDDRGAGKGTFSTESHNLDTVDVGGGAAPEILEADEAPTAKFSAPVLSERDANEKIDVCNDVLRRVSSAFDAVEGNGRGRAAIQLLVDGAPSKFTALLHDITVSETGELPSEDILDNLGGRPVSEHRQLINSALKNVIERALSSAADELPEESFDDVYESVAGYNQRLGL